MGINFFFTFPTSEGSDLLSSHVMQTPTFISKLSDGNVIFRLDVGKNTLHDITLYLINYSRGLKSVSLFHYFLHKQRGKATFCYPIETR
jgi:hypothetical protein